MSFIDKQLMKAQENGWVRTPIKNFLREKNRRSETGEEEVLGLSKKYGVLKKSDFEQRSSEAESYVGYKKVKRGQLISNKMQAWNGMFGLSKEDGITSPDYAIYEFINDVEPRFIEYVVRTNLYAGEFLCRSRGMGTGFLRLHPSEFLSTSIWLPPLPTQIEIADFLDRETARIGQLIRKKEQLLQTFPLRAEALIHEASTNHDVRWIRFGYTAKITNRPVSRENDHEYTPIGLYNRGRGIFHKDVTLGEDLGDSTFNWIKENDLIFSGQFAWEGAVALAGQEEEGKIASHRYPIYVARPGVTTAYLFSYFRTHKGQFLMEDCSRGAAGRNRPLNTNRLEKEIIPIPNDDAQLKIGELVQYESLIKKKVHISISKLQEFKDSLIIEAVTGQLDIQKWKEKGTINFRFDEIEEEMTRKGATA